MIKFHKKLLKMKKLNMRKKNRQIKLKKKVS